MLIWTIIVQWIHVILGIMWFGGNLYDNIVVIPAVGKQPFEEQQHSMPPRRPRNSTGPLAN